MVVAARRFWRGGVGPQDFNQLSDTRISLGTLASSFSSWRHFPDRDCYRMRQSMISGVAGGPLDSSKRWDVSRATLIQLCAEGFLVVLAVLLAFEMKGIASSPLLATLAPAFLFALLMVMMQGALGLYRRDRKIGVGAHAFLLFVALVIVMPVVYLASEVLPGGRDFRDAASDCALLAFGGLILVRHLVLGPLLSLLLPHRVLVLGTGPEARVVEASLTSADQPGMQLIGFYALEKVEENVVSQARVIARSGPLDETVRALGVNEIIVAVRQQRGGVLPLRALLECRLAGVRITDLPRFFERVHGQIPIDSLKASWLIYGNGFRQNWWRGVVKRAFDVVTALGLLAAALPIMLVTALLIALESGMPIIYRQERVGLRGKTFGVLKFRSMRQDAEKDGKAEWATLGDTRVTRVGRFIRRTRIDELPQLINVLRGEMSFVGPRPERPVFVTMLTEKIPFYAVRLSVKPGITGWAQVRYSYGADVEQSMKKLEYDLYYVKNHTLLLDIRILLETVRVVLFGHGAR
ncbi:MAG: TIGR03013 family XrtA/PEP-CTERM system glycosyltransferase [Casimicrobiaceae bacterium]